VLCVGCVLCVCFVLRVACCVSCVKRIQELIESGHVKRAKTLEAYPSDAGC